MKEYLLNVHKKSYNFIFAGVLVILYELGLLLPNPLRIENGIGAMFSALINMLPYGTLSISILLVLVGAYFIITDLREGVVLKPFHFVLMFTESLCWALLIFFNLSFIVTNLVGNSAVTMQLSRPDGGMPTYYLQDIALSFGAGFYEELFFRLFLIQFFFLIAKALQKDVTKWNVRLVIIIIASILFSAVHYVGSMGDTLQLNSFMQRFFFGWVMYPILMYRGFGIVAWTHALYDVLVFTMQRLG